MSSDIYEVKESPWAEQTKNAPPTSQRRRRRRRQKSFEEATNKEMSQTHQRRSKNFGFRRLRHQLKKPEFSKKFWLISFGVGGSILAILMLWEAFFRYPNVAPRQGGDADFAPEEWAQQPAPVRSAPVKTSPVQTPAVPAAEADLFDVDMFKNLD
jgi:hypothetical protein